VASRAPLSSECFSETRYLVSPPRLLPAGTTSCRVGLSPTGDRRLCTAHRIARINGVFAIRANYQTLPLSPLPRRSIQTDPVYGTFYDNQENHRSTEWLIISD